MSRKCCFKRTESNKEENQRIAMRSYVIFCLSERQCQHSNWQLEGLTKFAVNHSGSLKEKRARVVGRAMMGHRPKGEWIEPGGSLTGGVGILGRENTRLNISRQIKSPMIWTCRLWNDTAESKLNSTIDTSVATSSRPAQRSGRDREASPYWSASGLQARDPKWSSSNELTHGRPFSLGATFQGKAPNATDMEMA